MWVGIAGVATTLFGNFLSPLGRAWWIVQDWQETGPGFWDRVSASIGLEVPSALVPPLNLPALLLMTTIGVRMRDQRRAAGPMASLPALDRIGGGAVLCGWLHHRGRPTTVEHPRRNGGGCPLGDLPCRRGRQLYACGRGRRNLRQASVVHCGWTCDPARTQRNLGSTCWREAKRIDGVCSCRIRGCVEFRNLHRTECVPGATGA